VDRDPAIGVATPPPSALAQPLDGTPMQTGTPVPTGLPGLPVATPPITAASEPDPDDPYAAAATRRSTDPDAATPEPVGEEPTSSTERTDLEEHPAREESALEEHAPLPESPEPAEHPEPAGHTQSAEHPDLGERADREERAEREERADLATQVSEEREPADLAEPKAEEPEPVDLAEQQGEEREHAEQEHAKLAPEELSPGEVAAAAGVTLWETDNVDGFRDRWQEIQLRFIDNPRRAADQARGLVDDVINGLTEALSRQRTELGAWQGAELGDTEELRMAVRRYRDLLDQLLRL
jgi:hypothetical protein